MTPAEHELLRLRIQVGILQAVLLKLHVHAGLLAGQSLGEAIRGTELAIAIDDETIAAAARRSGLDAAEIGLREQLIQETTEQMRDYLRRLEERFSKRAG